MISLTCVQLIHLSCPQCLTSAQQFLLSAFKKSSRMLCPTTTRDMSPPKANKTVTALSPHKTKRKREGQHGHVGIS
ncbi:hypothetical protein JOB18_049659 [Solea senegalensis]|uniref:Secreted protein n=1 Tax=Solea senegalensis TaxID=28829 RepID=A0AAV6RW93_SOLSE|nr:hypothetical protein JOB18_049659 [Solea senegalensis]